MSTFADRFSPGYEETTRRARAEGHLSTPPLLSTLISMAQREITREVRELPQEDPSTANHYRLGENHASRAALLAALLDAPAGAQPDGLTIERYFVPATGGTSIAAYRGTPAEESLVAGAHRCLSWPVTGRLTFLASLCSEVTWFAVGDVGAHDGFITSRRGPAFPAEDGWTYQDVCGVHGTVIHEGTDRAEAQRALDAWLADCPGKTGRYCYTHNP